MMNGADELHGLFGGTFDPIHRGHIEPVREVAAAVGLARVVVVPAGVPPHRTAVAGAQQRLEMARIAVAEMTAGVMADGAAGDTADGTADSARGEGAARAADWVVDDIEVRRGAASYTVDTVGALRRRRYALLLGLDAALSLDRWHRWRALLASVHVIAIARAGVRLPAALPAWWRAARAESVAELRAAGGGRVLLVDAAPVAISATEVRARLAAGADVSDSLAPGVYAYIRRHNLYRAPAAHRQ